jgi:hypothetical protein
VAQLSATYFQLLVTQLSAAYSAATSGTIISSLFCSYLGHNYQQPILQLLVAQLSAAYSANTYGTSSLWYNYQQPVLQLLEAQLSIAYSAAPCGIIISSLF